MNDGKQAALSAIQKINAVKGSIRRRLQWSMSTSTPRRSDPGFR